MDREAVTDLAAVTSEHEAAIFGSCPHRMDDLNLSVVPYEHHNFEESSLSVETDAQFPSRVLVIQWATGENCRRGAQGVFIADPVLSSRWRDDHFADHSRTAVRIAVERSMPSRSARSISSLRT